METVLLIVIFIIKKLWKWSNYTFDFFFSSNVSKHNYCFSDFPFPDDATDFPHNKDMAKYIVDYTMHNKLQDVIQFETQARRLEKHGRCNM